MNETTAPGRADASRWGKNGTPSEERKFLQGPQARRFELSKAIRIFFEMLKGFRELHFVGPCVTVFGSARFNEDHPYYAMARTLGARLVEAGFTVMTGGGPGIMEAANRGAREAGGTSVGCNIELPQEQNSTSYLDHWGTWRYCSVRKVMVVKHSCEFVAMAGGLATLDELLEGETPVQTGKVKDFPIVLMGVGYWKPMIDFLRERMLGEQTI